jgi:hypothetical protein
MGQTTSLAKLVSDDNNCEWIYRIQANPGMRRGGFVPPTPVLAPGSALRSRPRVALSSAQAPRVYLGAHQKCKSRTRRRGRRALPDFAAGLGLRQLPFPLGPDQLTPTRQFIGRREIADRAMQSYRVVIHDVGGDHAPRIFET